MRSSNPRFSAARGDSACPRVRLADGPIASVDACCCGILHLQLGALTLRLTPEALASLLATLGEATAQYTARTGRSIGCAPPDLGGLGFGAPRGNA